MIEQNVVSLSLSKKLHELKIKKHSLFIYKYSEEGDEYQLKYNGVDNLKLGEKDYFAYTASELLEIIPYEIKIKHKLFSETNIYGILPESFCILTFTLIIHKDFYEERSSKKWWTVRYKDDSKITSEYSFKLCKNAHNLQDASAEMLIYLIENELFEY